MSCLKLCQCCFIVIGGDWILLNKKCKKNIDFIGVLCGLFFFFFSKVF